MLMHTMKKAFRQNAKTGTGIKKKTNWYIVRNKKEVYLMSKAGAVLLVIGIIVFVFFANLIVELILADKREKRDKK